eukprot:1143560-Pelagomonas_calceolata.AAC.7
MTLVTSWTVALVLAWEMNVQGTPFKKRWRITHLLYCAEVAVCAPVRLHARSRAFAHQKYVSKTASS